MKSPLTYGEFTKMIKLQGVTNYSFLKLSR